MPNPTEVCVIVVNGQRFDQWESVEVRRDVADDPIVHAIVTVCELNDKSITTAALMRFRVGDVAQVFLAGVLVVDGFIYMRQASCDANTHALQIGIASYAQNVVASTVEAKPGQYKNYSIEQIGKALVSPHGVQFKIVGSPANALLPFPRVGETVGESKWALLERLARFRNLHLLDTGLGVIEASRGPVSSSGATAVLQEGRNIEKARLVLGVYEYAENPQMVAQNANNNSATANADITATTNVPGPAAVASRVMKLPAEMMTDATGLKMRLDHEVDYLNMQIVDGSVTVPGWFKDDDATLWFFHVRESVTVNSPMLIPDGSAPFVIKGVSMRQSSEEGTVTEVFITNPMGLGREVPGANPSGFSIAPGGP